MKSAYLLLLLITLPLVCCNRPGEEHAGKPRVAMVFKTLNNPFFINMQLGAEAAAQRLHLDLAAQAAEREVDVEKQMQIIENLIQTRVDVLVVAPSGSKEILPSIVKANQAGIPVLIVDTRVDGQAAAEMGARTETFIGSDNYEGGRVAGQYVVEKFPQGAQVVILEGIAGHETGDSRLGGFREAIQGSPGIKVVASQPANWERDQGFNVMQNILEAHPGIDALFACNDMMALGAIEAIAAAGMSDRITVIGFDAIQDARDAIADGRMSASVAQFPGEIGRIAVESAAKVLAGERLPETIPVGIELITRENLGERQ